jgi:PAS domain S-box-containing protein
MEQIYNSEKTSKESWQVVLNSNSFAIWLMDNQLNIQFFNQNFADWMKRLYGLPLKQGDNLLDMLRTQPQSQAYWRMRIQKVLQSKMEFWFDDQFYLDGRPKNLRFRFFPIVENGEVTQITCYARESTATEDATAHSAAQFQTLIESAQDMIFAVNEYFVVTAQNKQFQEVMRHIYGAEVSNGKRLAECIPAYFSMIESSMYRALKGERHTEEHIFGKGLTSAYFETTFNPIRESTGIVKGVAVFSRDVTYRRKAERQAQKSSQLLASINKNITEAIFRSTPDHSIRYVNNAFLEMFGFTDKDEVTKHRKAFEFYVNPMERQKVVDQLLNERLINNMEIAFKRKDGSVFWGLLSSSMVEGEEGEIFFDGAIRDITSLRSAQKELQMMNDELQKANKALDSFVYTASHDLKAPLASIGGLISIFRMETDGKRKDEYLNMMEKSVKRLEGFIKDIVYYSRNSRAPLQPVNIALPELTQEVFEELRFSQANTNVALETHFVEDALLMMDRTRLEAILRNLISNAIHYSDKYKPQSFVRVSAHITQETLQLEVQDNGIGMEEVHLNRIFDMFYRISSGGAGSGLGLYIVKEALDKLGGKIEASSAIGEGSTFKVLIPNHADNQ